MLTEPLDETLWMILDDSETKRGIEKVDGAMDDTSVRLFALQNVSIVRQVQLRWSRVKEIVVDDAVHWTAYKKIYILA